MEYHIYDIRIIKTKYGPSIVMDLNGGENDNVNVFLPKRYSATITEDQISDILSKKLVATEHIEKNPLNLN